MEERPAKRVSIAIPTYFRPNYLELLLKSIERIDYDLSQLDILIIRHPRDHEVLKVVDRFKNRINIRVIETPIDSVSAMRNLGIKNASSDIVILVDDDIVLNPQTIRRALELLKEPNIAAVGFPALSPRPSLQEKLHHGRFLNNVIRGVNTVMPVTAFKRNILIKYTGLYREDMGPPYSIHEDWELGSRIRSKGYEIIIDGYTPQLHKPLIKSDHKAEPSDKTSKQRMERILSYVNEYISRSWRTFFTVMKSSPLSQRLEYMAYFMAPWLFIVLVIVRPFWALLYASTVLVADIVYSALIRRYYRAYRLNERLMYPLVLLFVRIIRTNLAVIGYLRSLVKPLIKSRRRKHES